MKKIPTLFVRDWANKPSLVLPCIQQGCEWVAAGEGKATQKFDGTCCMIRDGVFYKRRELKAGAVIPEMFELVETDLQTGESVGWIPVGDGPEDRFHREALMRNTAWKNGTYELVGPKVQGNPEHYKEHQLIEHGSVVLDDAPRNFDELAEWLRLHEVEGIVWQHPDGRMAKIKKRDFGLKRQ